MLSNAPPQALAFLAFGLDTSPPFPRDLSFLGLTGCRQYFAPIAVAGVITDSLGIARFPQAIPQQSSLLAQVLYSQFYPLDPGVNMAGVVASNYGRIQVGW